VQSQSTDATSSVRAISGSSFAQSGLEISTISHSHLVDSVTQRDGPTGLDSVNRVKRVKSQSAVTAQMSVFSAAAHRHRAAAAAGGAGDAPRLWTVIVIVVWLWWW
jgi:membrane peptidoglycan carboxypeptidase